MVWALSMPCVFGSFFPNGDFVGYDEQLTAHFESMSAESKVRFDNNSSFYRYFVASKFTCKAVESAVDGCANEIDEHEWPREFRAVKPYKLGSLISLNNGLLAVDQSLKDIIESLEPGLHRFRPLKITMGSRNQYPNSTAFFTMVVNCSLDSFSAPHSLEGSFSRGEGGSYSLRIPTRECFEGLAVSNKVFGGHHLWRESNLLSPEIFFSDELKAKVDRAGLKMPSSYRLKIAEENLEAVPGSAPRGASQKATSKVLVDESSVWGLTGQSNDLNLDYLGEFVGWDDTLRDYFENNMPTAMKSQFDPVQFIDYKFYVLDKLDSDYDEVRTIPLLPIEPIEKPTCYRLFNRADLGAMIHLQRLIAVEQGLMEIIESLEPGVHEFWPIDIEMLRDYNEYPLQYERYPKQYFAMIIGNYIDGFSPQFSDFGSWTRLRPDAYVVARKSKKKFRGLALMKSSFNGAHLWKERRLFEPNICFSGVLKNEAARHGIDLPTHFELKVIETEEANAKSGILATLKKMWQ